MSEALRMAVLPHVSGVVLGGPYGAGSDNAGLGLFFCREIAWRAGGSIWLVSGDAVLGTRGDVSVADDREGTLIPRVQQGTPTVLDFSGIRFVTQSFVHALLHDVLRIPGSLVRLSFVGCTRSTREVLRAVAAYAASYRCIV